MMITQERTHTAAIAVTPAGREELEQELQRLGRERLPALTTRLAEAREDSATRDEDVGLRELQDEHARLQRRGRDLDWLLATARENNTSADGVVALGSRVEIDEDGAREVFQLVEPCEANVAMGRLSIASPVGRILLNHTRGDEIVVPLPAGPRQPHIVALT